MKRLLLALVLFLASAGHAYAFDIEEVHGGGVKAWLVEDHQLPLIAMGFAFRGGVEQDPASKQGLANLTMNLLTEGAGPYDEATFQQHLADKSIALQFAADRDALKGQIKMLSRDRAEGFELLRVALTEPRFEKTAFERMRSQQLAVLRGQLGNPEWQARYALFQYIFGDHPYGERRLGTTETLASLTRNDVRTFAKDHLAKDNLVIAVAGDITPGQLREILKRTFGALPREAKLAPIPEVKWPPETASILVPRAGTQTDLLFAAPGPKRNDPDWYATEIANYILGGGGFSSRLMQEVRDKNGLTYGISTGLSPMDRGGMIFGAAATDNPKTAEAWNIALDTMRKFYDSGATEKEIQAAKDYLTGALPLAMTSTDKIASLLVQLQLEKLGRDYLERRNELFRRVTSEEVDRAVQRWFNPAHFTLSMVGKPDGMVPSQTRELTRN